MLDVSPLRNKSPLLHYYYSSILNNLVFTTHIHSLRKSFTRQSVLSVPRFRFNFTAPGYFKQSMFPVCGTVCHMNHLFVPRFILTLTAPGFWAHFVEQPAI